MRMISITAWATPNLDKEALPRFLSCRNKELKLLSMVIFINWFYFPPRKICIQNMNIFRKSLKGTVWGSGLSGVTACSGRVLATCPTHRLLLQPKLCNLNKTTVLTPQCFRQWEQKKAAQIFGAVLSERYYEEIKHIKLRLVKFPFSPMRTDRVKLAK